MQEAPVSQAGPDAQDSWGRVLSTAGWGPPSPGAAPVKVRGPCAPGTGPFAKLGGS